MLLSNSVFFQKKVPSHHSSRVTQEKVHSRCISTDHSLLTLSYNFYKIYFKIRNCSFIELSTNKKILVPYQARFLFGRGNLRQTNDRMVHAQNRPVMPGTAAAHCAVTVKSGQKLRRDLSLIFDLQDVSVIIITSL